MRAYDTTDSNARESTGDYEEEKRLKKLQEEGKLPSKERARRLSRGAGLPRSAAFVVKCGGDSAVRVL